MLVCVRYSNTGPGSKYLIGQSRNYKVRALATNTVRRRRTAEDVKTEEKGSDVNYLAVHLLNYGWLDACDYGVVLSDDSDIAEALRLERQLRGKRIGLVTPGKGRPSRQLMAHADFSGRIRVNGLRRSQLPDPIPGTNIRKPVGWKSRGMNERAFPPNGAWLLVA